MNEQPGMNEQTELTLKTHIERIVRPIIAVEKDKLRMRNELLAHALDAYQHEQTTGTEESVAVQQATRRLGDADQTRRELQATVGWSSRWEGWLDRFIRRPQGVSVAWHAVHLALKCAAALFVYTVLLVVPLRWADIIAWNYEGQLTCC